MNFGKQGRKKQKEQLHSKTKKTTSLINSVVLKVIVFAVVIVGVLGGAAAIGVYKGIIDKAPSIDNILETVVPVGYASIIYDQDGNEIQKLSAANANRIYLEYEQIPKCMIDAVVAVEDERFWRHNGFDMYAFMRAIVANIKSRSFSEGGSTLTQQVVKMNILKDPGKKIERKLQEQYLAVQLEKKLAEGGRGKEYAKKKILELYLNSAPFGKNSNGVQTAAQTYFNKNAWELTIAEAACIAGVANAPSRYDPISKPENNRERQRRILKKMLEQKYITQAEYDQALAEDVYGNIRSINQQMASNMSNYTYFVDEVILRLVEDLQIQKNYTEAQAYRLIHSGGLSIYVTQDLGIQKKLDDVYADDKNFFPNGNHNEVKLMYSISTKRGEEVTHHYKEGEFKDKAAAEAFIVQYKQELGFAESEILAEKAVYVPQPQSAMVIMDYHTGEVKALTGGRGDKSGNLTFNRATQAQRQPGSTFKPVGAYAAALDAKGYTLATTIDDSPVAIKLPNGQTYTPKNWNKVYKGLTTVREAIAQSMNIIAVRTIADITPELGFEYLKKLGFNKLQAEGDAVYAMPLGGIRTGVTPLEMTAAYGAIANKGVYIEPIFYTKVLDDKGNVLIDKTPETHRAIKETTAFLLTDAMIDVVRKGTGTTAAVKGMTISGKTGTTQDSNDLWFVGYSPYYAAAIWLGYDQPKSMNHISQSTHNLIWAKVMAAVHEDLPNKSFEVPAGITRMAVCAESGLLPVENLCNLDERGSTVIEEYFAVGTEPTEPCDVHKAVEICSVSGLFATEFCPPEVVQRKVMIQRREKDIPSGWDPSVPLPVADAAYEIPFSMIGEYCTVHGPQNNEQSHSNSDSNNGFFDSDSSGENNGKNGKNDNNDHNGNNSKNESDGKSERTDSNSNTGSQEQSSSENNSSGQEKPKNPKPDSGFFD